MRADNDFSGFCHYVLSGALSEEKKEGDQPCTPNPTAGNDPSFYSQIGSPSLLHSHVSREPVPFIKKDQTGRTSAEWDTSMINKSRMISKETNKWIRAVVGVVMLMGSCHVLLTLTGVNLSAAVSPPSASPASRLIFLLFNKEKIDIMLQTRLQTSQRSHTVRVIQLAQSGFSW